MKRFVSLIALLTILSLQACTQQTTSVITHDFDRYIVLNITPYVETAPGEFVHDDDVIMVDDQTDRTVFTPSFSEATVTLFADGSMEVRYPDDWHATCTGTSRSNSCEESDPTDFRNYYSLLLFLDVVIMPAEYYPLADYPVIPLMAPWQVLILIGLGLFILYAALAIVSVPIHQVAYRSKPATKVGAMLHPTREGQDGKTYWLDAYAATQTITDERQENYGKQPFDTNQDPTSSLFDRFRVGWPLLAASVLTFCLFLAAFLIW